MTSPHVITEYKAKPSNSRYPNLLPMWHFRCSCGHVDTTRYAPFRLAAAIEAHVASERVAS